MKNSIFFVLGLALGSGTIAMAAPGDFIYEASPPEVEITTPQAICFADCAIAAGAWDGARTDMISTCAHRTPLGFRASAVGLKTINPGDITAGSGAVVVVGRVE